MTTQTVLDAGKDLFFQTIVDQAAPVGDVADLLALGAGLVQKSILITLQLVAAGAAAEPVRVYVLNGKFCMAVGYIVLLYNRKLARNFADQATTVVRPPTIK